ncbi:MAG TPA: CDC27 family protein, partial [Cyclobacteriaceae bacterium]|nr:CDC27 family protein [Cyclobacteriaceae bacterium]
MMVRTFLVVIVLALTFSCSPEKKAAKNFRYGKYQKVINYYKSVLARQPNNGKANFYIAESYRLSNRLKEAEPYYEKAGGRGIQKDTVRLYYSKALKSNGKYDEARKALGELEASSENEEMKTIAQRELDGLDYLEKLAGKKSYYKIKNLEPINTPLAEYDPVYLNGELYFTSSRGTGRIYEATGTPFSDL